MSNIDRGRLGRLNDISLPATPPDGYSLVFNAAIGKWEPANISGQLAELAPPDASPLGGVLTGNPVKYTGKLPSGLTTSWYPTGVVAGATVSDLVLTTKATYNAPSATTMFNSADKGLLKLYINDALKATIDLGANFNEANRMGNQDITTYNTKGLGDIISGGVVTFLEGTFTVTSVGKYNNYSKWQKGNAKVVLNTELVEGHNNIHLVHDMGAAGTHTMNKLVMYYDNDTTAITFVIVPAVAQGLVATGKTLSGVKYYTTGDTFNINYTVDSPFKKAYHTTQVSDYSMQGISSITKNPAAVPAAVDQFAIADTEVAINVTNVMTNDARVTANSRDPYGNITTSQSSAAGRLVLTYSNRSTNIAEYFTDEVYRLPSTFDFNSTTATVSSVWNSATTLVNGEAQCYLSGTTPALVYPTANFSVSFLPTNAANYSAFTGDQKYMRAFIPTGNIAKSNVLITLNGIAAGLGTLGLGDVNVEIKLPGVTGWGDALKAYDSAVDKTVDGWGMLSGSVDYTGGNAKVTATFGGASTVNSGNRIYVRVTLRNGTRFITSMNVGW